MFTQLKIRNFKQFKEVEIELGNPVVFIGPNNSGKTTALQALALWDAGLRRWNERRSGRTTPEKRPGVTLNRRDLVSVPVPSANLLWRDLHVRDATRIENKPGTKNVLIEIIVDGVTGNQSWTCGLEFDYANEESFYCRPLRLTPDGSERMSIPPEAGTMSIAYLPPMSGLAANETRVDSGAINVRIGEGRTAEVLRNLCYQVYNSNDTTGWWENIVGVMKSQFGITLNPPSYIAERGEIEMTYQSESGIKLDLSSSGRGLQQVLLILAQMHVNQNSVILMDEPDAHLEILRQRQIYQVLSQASQAQNSQVIIASHSEVILNEAAERDVVVAFVGKPHRIDDRGSQVLKALKEIGFDQYYQAEQVGWVLYLEGSTDLAILRQFALILDHPAVTILERPFVHYIYNQPAKARSHFFGLREAKPNLRGIAILDRQDSLYDSGNLTQIMWERREIENYLCTREVLLRWAEGEGAKSEGPLYGSGWRSVMDEEIRRLEEALKIARRPSPWSSDLKVTDDFLDPLFENFFQHLQLPNLMRKTDYHILSQFVPRQEIDPQITVVLDRILDTAQIQTS
jgi:predicted ATPase